MKRNIIKQGNNAYTITLPVQWVRDNNLGHGEEIDVVADRNSLVISTGKALPREKSLKLKLKDDNFYLFRSVVISAYTMGFDRLVIDTDVKKAPYYLEKLTTRYLLGFEVTKHSESKFYMENVSEPSGDKFDTILRKVFLLCMDCLGRIPEYLNEPNAENYKVIVGNLDRIERYANFCRRIIIKTIKEQDTSSHLWLLISYLLKLKVSCKGVVDEFWDKKIKLNPKWVSIITSFNKEFNSLYESFYSGDIESANKVYCDNRLELKPKITALEPKSKNEKVLYHYLFEMNKQIGYLASPIISLGVYRKYVNA